MRDKAALRADMRAIRAAIPAQEAERQARLVAEHVVAWDVYRRAKCVMLYAPLSRELDVSALLDRVLADGKRLVLPRCEADARMHAVEVRDWRALPLGRFGVREPSSEARPLDPGDIDIALIPGLAFDQAGHRLGQGKGYYDRFLLGTRATVAGIGFVEQEVAELPTEPHDATVDYLITAHGIAPTHCKGGGAHERD